MNELPEKAVEADSIRTSKTFWINIESKKITEVLERVHGNRTNSIALSKVWHRHGGLNGLLCYRFNMNLCHIQILPVLLGPQIFIVRYLQIEMLRSIF